MDDALQERKAKVWQYLKGNPAWLVWVVLAFIAGIGYYIRTRSLPLLIDVTTGNYIPSDPDAMGILRYVQYIVEHGQLMSIDYMRYYPTGFTGLGEFTVLSHLIAYFYKIMHIFNPAVTVEYADVVYPAFAFVVALVFFFLLVRKVFDWKVALLASAFLTVLPAYLFRTLSGVSDKEAMAMIFFYLALYMFISFYLEKSLWKGVVYSVIAGLSMGVLWCIWGGVSFVHLTVGAFVLVALALERFRARHLLYYGLFLLSSYVVLLLFFPQRAEIVGMLTNPTSGIMFFAFAVGMVQYLVFRRDVFKLKSKIKAPSFLVSTGFVLGLALLFVIFIYDFSFITDRIKNLYIDLVQPFGRNRWALTVAESHQPYFTDVISQFSWKYLIMVYLGAVFLFYASFKVLGKKAYVPTAAFALFLIGFSMSRYSPSASLFNGETSLSILVYIGSLVAFIGYLVYFFVSLARKDHEAYKKFVEQISLPAIFMLLFLVFLLVGARSAVRLLFVFAPVTAILAAYFVFALAAYASGLKEKIYRYGSWIALTLFVLFLLNVFMQSTLAQAASGGPSYHQQWQYAMDWVRENTPEDAVFAHWWDYGYFVQTGGERATLSDGGNAHPAINHFIGRHLLTGENDTDALQLLAAKNATHVLVISDEIGKYGAFSSIGADADYDRYSWISAFMLDQSQSQETRNGTNLAYTGSTALDDDFTYQGTLFPAFSSGIGGFLIPVITDENGTFVRIEQPMAILVYNGQSYSVPLRCVFFNGQEYLFEEEGLDACVQLIPDIRSDSYNPIGGALYLSHDVWNTWFTQHYLFGKDSEGFTTVYNDESSVPLAIYNGRIIGPMKIWEVTYPEDLYIPEEYYGTEIPVEVTKVKDSLY